MLAIQSEDSRNRGIGRYSLDLVREIVKKIPDDISLIFNALYGENKTDKLQITQQTNKEIPSIEYDVLDISDKKIQSRRNPNKLNTLLLNRQLNNCIKGDISVGDREFQMSVILTNSTVACRFKVAGHKCGLWIAITGWLHPRQML